MTRLTSRQVVEFRVVRCVYAEASHSGLAFDLSLHIEPNGLATFIEDRCKEQLVLNAKGGPRLVDRTLELGDNSGGSRTSSKFSRRHGSRRDEHRRRR